MMLSTEQIIELIRVENQIQKLLWDLDGKLAPFQIDRVEIDTRKFENMRTEIHTKERRK